jgi:transcriptional regulator with XRE-family HTH domain
MSEFASWLIDQRNSRGWTQEDVASRVGVGMQQVYRWENGRNKPPPERMKAISRLYGVEYEALKDAVGAGKRPPEPPPEARDNRIEVTFFARQKLRGYAHLAGMPSEAIWISRLVEWIEDSPELFRRYVLEAVRAGFEPSYSDVTDREPPATRPAEPTVAG